jgi:hypothetical protein
VEASDIVPTAINAGDSSYTGCEEEGRRSDERVRKMTERMTAASLSNQIHNAQGTQWRKPWKSGPTFEFRLQTSLSKSSAFSANAASLLWKTREQISSPVIFLMHSKARLCQTE